MKKSAFTLLLCLVALLSSLVSTAQQTTKEEFLKDPTVFSGYHHPYIMREGPLSPAPRGYKPFYIFHFGRHGSRYDISDKSVKILKVLDMALADDALTDDGIALRDLMLELQTQARGREGELSTAGLREHEGIASRMIARYPEVFKGRNVYIDARSSDVQRCILSMAAFCGEIKAFNPSAVIDMESAPRNFWYIKNGIGHELRDSGYKQLISDYAASLPIDISHFISLVFKDGYASKALKDGGRSLYDNTILMSHFMGTMGRDLHLFDKYFTPEDYWLEWKKNNYSFYTKYGPSNEFAEYLVGSAAGTLQELLRCGDAAAAGYPVANASLTFSHDSHLVPFLACLNVDGLDVRCADPDDLSNHFSDFKTTPMAGNLQFIFFRNRAGDVIFKILHNEGEASLPIASDIYPYYRWSEARIYIESRIEKYLITEEKAALLNMHKK